MRKRKSAKKEHIKLKTGKLYPNKYTTTTAVVILIGFSILLFVYMWPFLLIHIALASY